MGTKSEKKRYKKIDVRGVPKKRVIGHLGEPGRFRVFGSGIRQGVRHFSC